MNSNIEQTLLFIRQYRKMEDGDDAANRSIILRNVPEHVADHLWSSWKGRGNDFGDFFLNLDHATQANFIESWGIPVPELEQYKADLKRDPIAALFLDPPPMVHWLHELLKFFYNHGIMNKCASGVYLKTIPDNTEKRYGNSRNWADYILALDEAERISVLSAIESYSTVKK